jgi:hypothetical protein
MPGMGGSPIQLTNPIVVAIFRHALFVTSVFWILGLGLAVLVVTTVRGRTYRFNLSDAGLNEPRSRTYLRWGYGALWLFAGILQFQPSMPLGPANDVVAPASIGVPAWLHALMFTGIGVWNNHPVVLVIATGWIQVGIGILLLVSNGMVGRITAGASVGWASMIWLVGNGVGGIFSPTSSILFGWPGATFFYAAAGVWLVIDYQSFSKHFARYTTRGLSALLLIGSIVQCLPEREFWHVGGHDGRRLQPGCRDVARGLRCRTVDLDEPCTALADQNSRHWLCLVLGHGRGRSDLWRPGDRRELVAAPCAARLVCGT